MRCRWTCLATLVFAAVTACATPGPDSGGTPTTTASTTASAPAASASATTSSGTTAATSSTTTPSTTSATTIRPTTATSSSTTAASTATSTSTRTTSTTSTSTRTTTTSTTTAADLSAWLGKDWERLPTTQKIFALTFDAGASDAGVSRIVSTLVDRHVPATFFVTGQFARTYPGAVRVIDRGGLAIGNHSDTHPHFPDLTNDQIAVELARAEASISALTGETTKPLFRFPFGDRETLDITVVNRLGYVPFRWTIDSLGWQGTSSTLAGSAAAVCKRVVNAAVPGGIALMHVGANPDDGTTFDADALPCIISGIAAKGYRFVDIPSHVG